MTIELSQSFCSFLRNVKEMFSSILVIINISIAQPASPSKSKDIYTDNPGEYHHTLKTHFGLGYKKNNL